MALAGILTTITGANFCHPGGGNQMSGEIPEPGSGLSTEK